jgi:hypothetical protein
MRDVGQGPVPNPVPDFTFTVVKAHSALRSVRYTYLCDFRTDLMEPSFADTATGTPAPYGQACANCARAKCKCILRIGGGACDRYVD